MNQAVTFQTTRPIIPAGTQLNGIYEIDEPIAAGGMGEIYKGHAIQTGDLVAIKLIRSDLAAAEAAFALFRKEAAALHNLYHEAIVRYYVFTVDPVLERPYLAMEFVDGQSLSTLLRGGPLAFEAVNRLMRRIAAGLQAAHEQGIIHRDVSPDNIIIPAGEMARAKIIDFGIARSTRLDDEGTIIGSGFAGKYNYVSPEQLGLFGGEVTPKSDIYSLGLVLAEALRHGPIDMGGNHFEVIEKRRVVPDIGQIDPRLRPLIERMLQPNPADRPGSMAEVAAWTIDAPRFAPPVGRAPLAPHKPAASITIGRIPVISGAVVLAVAAGTAALYGLTRPEPQKPPPPPPTLTHQAAPAKPALAPMNLAKLDLAASPRLEELAGVVDPARRARIDAVTSFVAGFDGGDCFFAKPVAISDGSATIEGYARSTLRFRELDENFRRAHGFEADIGVRRVDPGQCPAVSFLGRLGNSPGRAIELDITASSLKVGQALEGRLTGLDGREADVVIVADDGSVRRLPTTRGQDDSLSFSSPTGSDLANGKLQLVLAVASLKPLASLRTGSPASAGKYFGEVLAEAARRNEPLTVAARSFKAVK